MAVLFIILAVGFVIGKCAILTADGNRVLTRVVLFIGLPCTVLNSVFGYQPDVIIGDTLLYLLMCFLSFGVAFAIAIPLVRISRGDKKNHGLLTYMSVFSNCGFMGFPVAIAIFGMASGLFTAMYNIAFNVLSFSVGIMLVAGWGGKFKPKLLLNPPLIASLLAIPIAFTGFSPPFVVAETVRIAGGITTPGAMLVIGASLSYIPLKNVFSEWRIWLSAALRLALIPLVVWLVFKPFIADELMLGVLVVMSAMPSAAQSAMFAIQYDGNEQIASAGVFVSTLLCVVTIPVLVWLLFM